MSLAGSYAKAVAGALPVPGFVPVLGVSRPKDVDPSLTRSVSGFTVDLEHLADYDRVCGFRFGGALPGTYLHMAAFPLQLELMTEGSFPFGVLGLVHVENRIEVLRPAGGDETFDVTVHAENLRPHPAGRAVDLVSSASVDGEEVWREVSTYLRPGGGSGSDGEKKKGPRKVEEPPRAAAIWRVPDDIGRRYAAVSGDRNPIHLHPLSAKAFGMPGAIAHGMWVKARCLAALEGQLPADGRYAVEVSFKKPLVLPSKVAFSSTPGRKQGVREFGVRSAKSGKPHLTGSVAPL
ncbi:MAG TPA: MaoC/PaaZ C-terminal domain-containing protein [Solirubrobacteraceae bacterium]|nr:MaoC/PaaZ C-terminal domain-containing protein [Solirubrobacteraceae bacterium]